VLQSCTFAYLHIYTSKWPKILDLNDFWKKSYRKQCEALRIFSFLILRICLQVRLLNFFSILDMLKFWNSRIKTSHINTSEFYLHRKFPIFTDRILYLLKLNHRSCDSVGVPVKICYHLSGWLTANGALFGGVNKLKPKVKSNCSSI
jgi:hypothetical protein